MKFSLLRPFLALFCTLLLLVGCDTAEPEPTEPAATVAPTEASAENTPAPEPTAPPMQLDFEQAPALPGAQAISPRDRVYTADQSSNTVSVINPATNEVLGTIALGEARLDGVLGPVDTNEVNVHGLGFSPDGSMVSVIDVTSNAAQLIDAASNRVMHTTYVGRSPHEGFITPNGAELWVVVRGQDYIAVIDTATGAETERITVGDGPSKVLFSPDGTEAYVNHVRAQEFIIIDMATRTIAERIAIPEENGGTSDFAVSPDGVEVWMGHPGSGKTTVINLMERAVEATVDSGPRTNHPQFVTTEQGNFAYVTVGDLNETQVYRRSDDMSAPELVTTISHAGFAPHGIWPSPDNTRIYVALQKSDAVDVIDTATNEIIATLRVGQDPQALVYVANAVAEGSDGTQNLTQQGIGQRVENMRVEVQGIDGDVFSIANIRALGDVDEIDVRFRMLPADAMFDVYAAGASGTAKLMTIGSDGNGVIGEALAFTKFFDNYDRLIIVPMGATVAAAGADAVANTNALMVQNQSPHTGRVTIATVHSTTDGWVALHYPNANGRVVGYAPVHAGVNQDVTIAFNATMAAAYERLTVVLYTDAGEIGVMDSADLPTLSDTNDIIAVTFGGESHSH